MPRTRWYESVLDFLAEQPSETTSITLTFAEVEVLVGGELPVIARTRNY